MDNLKEQVARQLNEWGLSYNLNEKKSRFELDLPMDNVDVSINLVYDEKNMRLHNLSYLPFNLPKRRTTEVLYAINKIHNTSWELAHLYLEEENNRLAVMCLKVDWTQKYSDISLYQHASYWTKTLTKS